MKQKTSFAQGFNFYKLFGIFYIGCFLGVIIESIWCMITRGYYESRTGLIYGYLNPVYGFGALVMTLALKKLAQKRDLYIFIAGSVIGGIYEYICSLFQEKMFGTVSWDYSDFQFNLNGRVNLLYCLFWGILALVWIKNIYPYLSAFIEKIPNRLGISLTWCLVIFILFDVIISGCAVIRMEERVTDKQPDTSFEQFLDRHYPDEKLQKIYPNMIDVKNQQ